MVAAILGAIALVAAIVGIIITIYHWLSVSYIERGESVAMIKVNYMEFIGVTNMLMVTSCCSECCVCV